MWILVKKKSNEQLIAHLIRNNILYSYAIYVKLNPERKNFSTKFQNFFNFVVFLFHYTCFFKASFILKYISKTWINFKCHKKLLS